MEKYIKADEGFGVLDRLFARIQEAAYQATQEMLDKAWEEWRNLANLTTVTDLRYWYQQIHLRLRISLRMKMETAM